MADTAVAITAGSGTNIDTRTEATNGNHRQVVVIGDPSTNAGVAPVDATNGVSVTLTTAIPAGTAAIGKLAANSGVDIGDVDVTSIIPGTGATNLGKAIDTATGGTDTGVLSLATRDDALSTLTPAEGDNVQLRVNSVGAVYTVGTKADGTVVDPVAAGSAAMAASVPVTIATNDTQFNKLYGRFVQLVPTCNTDAHTSGDLIAATEVLSACTPGDDIPGRLIGMSVTRLDSATGVDIVVWFLKANSSFGTESSAFAVADADADDVLFKIAFAASDFTSLGTTNCFAQTTASNYPIARMLKPASGTDDVYIAITAAGSVDLGAATDLVLSFDCM